MVISINAKEMFEKTQHAFIRKALKKLRIEGSHINT
jgi:hypothetical protein